MFLTQLKCITNTTTNKNANGVSLKRLCYGNPCVPYIPVMIRAKRVSVQISSPEEGPRFQSKHG